MRSVYGEARRSAGFTLLELIVVMAVLVALSAILVPMLPESVGKANQSAAATNMAELEKAVMAFRGMYNRQPNHFDSMLNVDGEPSGLVPAAGGYDGPCGGTLEVIELTKGQQSRLKREGITMIYDIEDALPEDRDPPVDDSEFHATLNPYVSTQAYGEGRSIGTGEKVMALKRIDNGDGTFSYNDKVLNRSVMPGVILNPDHQYAVFGIGRYCTLCGPDGLVREAPVFGQHKAQSTPGEGYQRFAAVYDIGKPDDDTNLVNAKFVGCVAMVGKRLFTAGDIVGQFHDGKFDISEPRE
jgi:prepilin-type N-terminal cleavage/methylation domain-containing protein